MTPQEIVRRNNKGTIGIIGAGMFFCVIAAVAYGTKSQNASIPLPLADKSVGLESGVIGDFRAARQIVYKDEHGCEYGVLKYWNTTMANGAASFNFVVCPNGSASASTYHSGDGIEAGREEITVAPPNGQLKP